MVAGYVKVHNTSESAVHCGVTVSGTWIPIKVPPRASVGIPFSAPKEAYRGAVKCQVPVEAVNAVTTVEKRAWTQAQPKGYYGRNTPRSAMVVLLEKGGLSGHLSNRSVPSR